MELALSQTPVEETPVEETPILDGLEDWVVVPDSEWLDTMERADDILATLGIMPNKSDTIDPELLPPIYRVIVGMIMKRLFGKAWEEQNPNHWEYSQMLGVFKRLKESLEMHSYVRYDTLEKFAKSTTSIIESYEKEVVDSRKSWGVCSGLYWIGSTALSMFPYVPYGAVGCAMVSQVGVVGTGAVAIEAAKIAGQLALKSASSIRYLVWVLSVVFKYM